MLITFERKVPQSSYPSQNDHKSKGNQSKTSAAQAVPEYIVTNKSSIITEKIELEIAAQFKAGN